jgi:tRNA/rRNA methyltransferase
VELQPATEQAAAATRTNKRAARIAMRLTKGNTARAVPSPSEILLVLNRPRSLDNVGAVARVVKNFGLGRLILVDPLSYSFERAGKLAVGAEDVVEALGMEKDLASALSTCVFSVGTSSRSIRKRRSLEPGEAAVAILAAPRPAALVFGDEKRGLSDEDLSFCQAICRIPASAAQPSLNLAQAAAVMAYALCAAARAGAPAAPTDGAEDAQATLAEQAELHALLGQVLLEAAFLNPQNPRLILEELRRPFERAGLTKREVQLWKTALKKLGHVSARRSGP